MPISSLAERKSSLRQAMLVRRAAMAAARPDAAQRFAEQFLTRISVAPGAVISGYIAMRHEIDPAATLDRLAEAGHETALPVVVAPGLPLIFRLWRKGMPLVQQPFGILEPAAGAPERRPEIVIVPLLAFDRGGYRLGYGGGYYDRTLVALRREGTITAVGAAYAQQEVGAVPHGNNDAKLDWVVTEREAIRIGSGGS